MAEHLSSLWATLRVNIIPTSGYNSLDFNNDLEEETRACIQSCILSINKVMLLFIFVMDISIHKTWNLLFFRIQMQVMVKDLMI